MSVVPEVQVRSWLEDLSNWGRWGPDDQRGTLNYITPDVIRAAIALVTDARQVSCSLRIAFSGDRTSAHGVPALGDEDHLVDAARYVLHGADDPNPAIEARHVRTDAFLLAVHGIRTTHLDAPTHTSLRGTIFNGISTPSAEARAETQAGSIELAATGIATRSVLLDVPRALGREWLEDGEGISPADLELCEAVQGVRIRTGDMLMVRTGYRLRNPTGEASIAGLEVPGLDASCLPWLHAREVAVLATDVVADKIPNHYPSLGLPIHTIGMWAMGLWLIDACWLEELSATCQELARWEGLVVANPLLLENGTGSPLNPVVFF